MTKLASWNFHFWVMSCLILIRSRIVNTYGRYNVSPKLTWLHIYSLTTGMQVKHTAPEEVTTNYVFPNCLLKGPRRPKALTHWGQEMHICISKLTIIGSDNGLSPGRRQAIIWINVGILSIGPLQTNFSEILIEIYTLSFKKMHLKMSSGKWRPFWLGLNVLMWLSFVAPFSFIELTVRTSLVSVMAWHLWELRDYSTKTN